MFAGERQKIILKQLKKGGAVSVSELTRQLGVSDETVRRDLLRMEKEGLLCRVHGGAVQKNTMYGFFSLKERNNNHSLEKTNLSKTALKFISEGDIIGIDSGSTAIALADEIKTKFQNLTIITNSIDVFNILADFNNFNVILCGGNYLSDERAFCGSLALNMLSSLHMEKVFIFPSAISLKFGISDFCRELYTVQSKLMECADKIFILVDSSKFEKTGLYRICHTDKRFTYITDTALSPELIKLYAESDIKIYTGDKNNE